jgi:hypothetical protein
MKPESKLLRAARVFDFITGDYKHDDAVIGLIGSTVIHVGEIRRLSEAIAEEDARRAAPDPDPAEDGPEVEILTRFYARRPTWGRQKAGCASKP